MINLLAPDEKRALQAAKTNVLLLRYNIMLLGVVGIVVLVFGFVYVMLGINENSAKSVIASNNSKVASYASTRQEATAFANNLTTAKQIFAGEINYTGLLTSIANTMPAGTILQQFTIDPTTIGKPTTLTAQVKSTNDALALKDAFVANAKLFSNAYLVSITGNSSSTTAYPYLVVIGVTINPGGF